MSVKKVTLTIPEPMFRVLEKERQKFMYHSVQEIILEALRDKFVRYRKKETKRGRPKKFDLMRVGSAKKIFK